MTNVAMHDIFISYANQDRAAAEMIARTLETRGWRVWWDRNIPPGRSFDEVIGEALDRASCVVVLWSRASVSSEWVKEEAAEGARRKILVPVMIEDVPIPLGLTRLSQRRHASTDASRTGTAATKRRSALSACGDRRTGVPQRT